MQRLGALDSLFVSLETARWPMHLTGYLVLEPPAEAAHVTFERVKARFAERLPRLGPLRRRLVEVPLGVDRAYWIEDPDFDLDRHFHHAAVPVPGSGRELADLVSRIADQPLDRSKPLWECWFLEGLEGDRTALVLKIHHACLDGLGGLALFDELFDPLPGELPDCPTGEVPPPDRVPSELELAVRSIPDLLLLPVRSALTVARIVLGLERAHQRSGHHEAGGGEALRAPRTVFNRDVPGRAHRTVATTSVPLADVLTVKDAYGTTVNDVVLTLVAGALRGYLSEIDELPESSLVVANPVGLREAGDESGGNKLSIVFPRLRSDLADPVQRLRAVHAGTVATKDSHHARGQEMFEQVAGLFSPVLMAGIAQLYGGAHFAKRIAPFFNALVSNVAGPTEERFLCGARVEGMYGVALLYEGVGLFVALVSLAGRIHFSVTGARELTPDLWPLADGIGAELDRLVAGLPVEVPAAEAATPPGP